MLIFSLRLGLGREGLIPCKGKQSRTYRVEFVTSINDRLLDLVPFVQLKKREKYPWRSVTLSKVAGLLKVTLLHGYFPRFLNCTNTKSRKASHI